MMKTDNTQNAIGIKTERFIKECESAYGVNCGVCGMDNRMFHTELRKSCEVNTCGNYGNCHTCPPNIGTAEHCIEKLSAYDRIIVYQRVYPLEDSFDFYGMIEAKNDFGEVIQNVAEKAREIFNKPLILGAGGCSLCERCAAKDGEVCRHPEKAIQSLEANCIQVSELAELSGMKYINGQNTVTYFGGVFLIDADEA